MYFSTYHDTKSHMALTMLSMAKAILTAAGDTSEVTVYVDGLPKARLRWFGVELRRLGIRTRKVAGVRRRGIRCPDAARGCVDGRLEKGSGRGFVQYRNKISETSVRLIYTNGQSGVSSTFSL